MCQILTDPDLQHCACIVYSNEGRLGFKIWLALCKKWLEFALKTEPFTLERIQWPGLRARYRCDRLGFCGYSDNILDSAAVLSQTAWLSAVMTAFSLTQRCHDSSAWLSAVPLTDTDSLGFPTLPGVYIEMKFEILTQCFPDSAQPCPEKRGVKRKNYISWFVFGSNLTKL